ncbi:MAG: VOC family protein, partial [Gammaproteobacteria bacterium]
MQHTQKIAPCLWFDNQAEEAARFYVSIFRNSRLVSVSHYGKAGYEVHRKPAGTVMTVAFELDGQPLTALNGGPEFKFNEAVSFFVECKDQAEVDMFWDKLTADGGAPSQCGWLKDKFGLSWQIVPDALIELTTGKDAARAQRVFAAMMKMVKIDIPT